MTYENMNAFYRCEQMLDNPEKRQSGRKVMQHMDNDQVYSVTRKEYVEPFNYIMKHTGAEVRGHGEKAAE